MTFKNNTSNLSSLLCSRICAGLHWPPPVFPLFCLQLYSQCYNFTFDYSISVVFLTTCYINLFYCTRKTLIMFFNCICPTVCNNCCQREFLLKWEEKWNKFQGSHLSIFFKPFTRTVTQNSKLQSNLCTYRIDF